jgi:DNA-directed RNA polymerase subunit RPC12/RpoP
VAFCVKCGASGADVFCPRCGSPQAPSEAVGNGLDPSTSITCKGCGGTWSIDEGTKAAQCPKCSAQVLVTYCPACSAKSRFFLQGDLYESRCDHCGKTVDLESTARTVIPVYVAKHPPLHPVVCRPCGTASRLPDGATRFTCPNCRAVAVQAVCPKCHHHGWYFSRKSKETWAKCRDCGKGFSIESILAAKNVPTGGVGFGAGVMFDV